jgi:hypothetical protein
MVPARSHAVDASYVRSSLPCTNPTKFLHETSDGLTQAHEGRWVRRTDSECSVRHFLGVCRKDPIEIGKFAEGSAVPNRT